MILNSLFIITLLNSFLLIHTNEQFHFGIINHHTQWYFHCPYNNTKLLNPPSNEQPLISYECPPHPSTIIEILPIEIDFTFLCRSQSRLLWLIIDLYQYNTFSWLINNKDIETKIELNNEIKLTDYKSEINNFTNRFIIINAFYIPFESLDILLNKPIEINIEIKHRQQSNQCQFFIKDKSLWKTFIDSNCDSTQSKTLVIQYAKCDFYFNKTKSNLQSPVSDENSITSTSSTLPDFNVILSIDEKQHTTQSYDYDRSMNSTLTTSLRHYLDRQLVQIC